MFLDEVKQMTQIRTNGCRKFTMYFCVRLWPKGTGKEETNNKPLVMLAE